MAEAELKAAAAALDQLVAESVHDATMRARLLEEGTYGDPEEAAQTIRYSLARRKGILQAMTLLATSIKNAEATLKKLEVQSLKDAATLDELRAKGPGGEIITPREPFVMDIATALKASLQKAEFASADCEKFAQMIQRDSNLRGMLPRSENAEKAYREMMDAKQGMDSAQQCLRSAISAVSADFR